MLKRIGGTFGALVVLVAIATGLSLISPLRRPPSEPVDLVRATELACVQAGRVFALGEGEVTATPQDGGQPTLGTGSLEAAITVASLVRADSWLVAGVLTEQPTRAWTGCAAPAPAGLLQVAEAADYELVVVNTDANEAVLDLTLYGADGELTPVGARGIAVAPGVSRVVALSVLAPAGPVGVGYTASSGRAAVIARPVEGRTGPVGLSTTPQPVQLIDGIPAAASSTRLLLTNPTPDRAEVKVLAMGATASYEPAPAAGLTLPAMSTAVVDLGTSLGGEASALQVTAAAGIGATVLVEAPGGAASLLVPAAPATELGALVPAAEALQLTNPGEAAAMVTVTVGEQPQSVEVGPLATVTLPLTVAAPTPVRVSARQPVLATAGSGGAMVPLLPTERDEATAGVVVLDPGLR